MSQCPLMGSAGTQMVSGSELWSRLSKMGACLCPCLIPPIHEDEWNKCPVGFALSTALDTGCLKAFDDYLKEEEKMMGPIRKILTEDTGDVCKLPKGSYECERQLSRFGRLLTPTEKMFLGKFPFHKGKKGPAILSEAVPGSSYLSSSKPEIKSGGIEDTDRDREWQKKGEGAFVEIVDSVQSLTKALEAQTKALEAQTQALEAHTRTMEAQMKQQAADAASHRELMRECMQGVRDIMSTLATSHLAPAALSPSNVASPAVEKAPAVGPPAVLPEPVSVLPGPVASPEPAPATPEE